MALGLGNYVTFDIRPLHVRPGGRQRSDSLLPRHAEEDAVLTPGVGVADQLELLAAQGMEWVGDGEPCFTFWTTSS